MRKTVIQSNSLGTDSVTANRAVIQMEGRRASCLTVSLGIQSYKSKKVKYKRMSD